MFIIVHYIDLSQGGWGPPQTIQTLRNEFASWLFLDGEVDHFIRASPVRVWLDDSKLLLAIMFKLFCNWVHTKQLTSTDRVHCINLYPAQRPPSTLVQFWLRLYASPGSGWSWTRGRGYTDVADVYVLFSWGRGEAKLLQRSGTDDGYIRNIIYLHILTTLRAKILEMSRTDFGCLYMLHII